MARPTLLDRLRAFARRARLRPRPTPPVRPPGRSRPDQPAGLADFQGVVHPVYEPVLDGDGDPGEIVWTWVPFEEDASRGKDRPVLVVGRDGHWLLGLMLTSKDHDRDAASEARHGRYWLDIGSGSWDAQRRPSEVRLDRVLRLDPDAVRREGAILDRATFDRVAAWLRNR
ncbi:MAG: type II toxin-antitoxin system PemK/MazF family toxin [Cellulomonas sp.]